LSALEENAHHARGGGEGGGGVPPPKKERKGERILKTPCAEKGLPAKKEITHTTLLARNTKKKSPPGPFKDKEDFFARAGQGGGGPRKEKGRPPSRPLLIRPQIGKNGIS